MKITTSTILGNALIELINNKKKPIISVEELQDYTDVIKDETSMDAHVSGLDLFKIKGHERSHIKFLTDTMEFTIADHASVGDLISRYQTDISENVLNAFKSKKSYDFLGIKYKSKAIMGK
ncbi:MAG: hypothetical protein IKP79_03235 [Bacilli bacterium]|nr:hypothetical protein [Bacilli bacterium]